MRKRNFNIWLIVLFISLFGAVIMFYCDSQEQRETDACLKCHSKEALGLNKRYLHPLIKDGRCKACHRSYDETTHKETGKPTLEICLSCHAEDKLGRSHPVGRGVIDPNTNDEMTCTSTCHLRHSSDYNYQLPYKNNMELCVSCHKDF